MKKNIDVLIIAPTLEELKEIQKFLPNSHLNILYFNSDNFPWLFDKGTIRIKGKEYIIHVISIGMAGQRKNRTILSDALKVWLPNIVILVGVAGSIDKDVNYGDIILPRNVWIYDLSKVTQYEKLPQLDSCKPTEYLVTAAMRFFSEKKWGKKINENFFNYLPFKPAKNICHADGNIVSSGDLLEKILENSDGIAKIKNADRKTYGVEEEAGGVGEELKNTNIPWLDIRVVMDLSDPHSRNPKYKDRNKQQASEIAGKYCIEFIRWYFRRSFKENGKILTKRLKSELKQDDYLSKFNEFKFENILYSTEVKPFRPDGPKIIDFEKEEWVYIPKSFIDFNFNKIAILGGYSGTGKSVIARYIGYYSMHLRNKSVYYIDFLELNKNDKDNLVENIDSIIINPLFKQATNIFRNILFIFENIHDPEINKINFLRKLKTLTKRISVLLTTRESKINEIYYYDWIEKKNLINFDELPELNKEIIRGILAKVNKKREEEGLTPLNWDVKDKPENLWLLGWFLRIITQLENQEITINYLLKHPKKLKREIKNYYKKLIPQYTIENIPDLMSEHIITTLLIISIASRHETYLEENFIFKYGIKSFSGLSVYTTKEILKLLTKNKEILCHEFESLGDPSLINYEYRIPHIRLAEIFQDYYADKTTKNILEKILHQYIKVGKNKNILGHSLWQGQQYYEALDCFKLVRREENAIKKLIKNYHFNMRVLKNHVINLELTPQKLKMVPEELQHFPNLEVLNLGGNQISEIRGLDKFKNLKVLNIQENQIKEIKGLENLIKLRELILFENQISEIKGLENLKDLQMLIFGNPLIGGNQIEEIKGLDKLYNLQTLTLTYNQIKEIKGFENLTNLRELDLLGNQIEEIKGLDKLRDLQVLNLDDNRISMIKGLDKLTNLQFLILGDNKIKEIEGLEKLIYLQLLYLTQNQIQEIKGLEELINLQKLHLRDNKIEEINGLEELINLQLLHLAGNKIEEINGLEKLVKLKVLYLRENQITEIKGLETLVNLEKLILSDNKFKPIPELGMIPKGWNSVREAQKYVKYCQQIKKNYHDI